MSLHFAWRPCRSPPEGFTRGLFLGKLNTDFFYPYPEPEADDLETLGMVVSPFESFMQNENDPAKNDETGDVDPAVAEALKPMGAYGMMVPEEYGGVGLNSTGYARLVEVVGSQDLGLGIFLGAHQSIGYKGITLYGNEEQKKKYLPGLASGDVLAAFCLTEPSSGSDAQSIRTRAMPADDGSGDWVLNGGKSELSQW
jgi:very long chain acyl-CoA dehydrogenase